MKSLPETKDQLVDLLGVKQAMLDDVLKNAPSMYRPYPVRKKSGGTRIIEPPLDDLKKIQSLINERLLSKIHSHEAVFPRKKASIKDVLLPHEAQPVVIACDISDFFPSLRTAGLKSLFSDLGFSNEMTNLLLRLTTYKGHVPQGAPTSSSIARLYVSDLANSIEKYIADIPHAQVSIYADDIIISGPVGLKRCLPGLNKIANRYKLKFNHKKNRVMQDPADQKALGVKLNPQLHLDEEYSMRAIAALEAGKLQEYKGMISFKKHIES